MSEQTATVSPSGRAGRVHEQRGEGHVPSTGPAHAWQCVESCEVFGDYIEIKERITSGRARGEVRIHVGWARRPAVGIDPLFWRWDGACGPDGKGAPVMVRAIAWRPHVRDRVTWTQPTADPVNWAVSREDAERRVIRACKTAGVQSGWRPKGHASGLAAMIGEVLDTHRGEADEITERFQPRPADISDMLTAMRWFAALKTDNRRPKGKWDLCYEQQLIAIRASAPGEEWLGVADVARVVGRSRQVIDGHYRGAINEIWALANGGADT